MSRRLESRHLRSPRRRGTAGWMLPGSIALAVALTLGGCAAEISPDPTATAASGTVTPTASPTATGPVAPTLVAEGTAEDNLPLFDAVVQAVWNSGDSVSGRAYVDALVAAGFDKGAMQVTSDETTVGNPAETIQFSVRWGADCLVGQVGPATGRAVASVLPGLETGGCLIGDTRPIDW